MPHRRSSKTDRVRFRKLTIPERAHPLVKRLYQAMNQQQISPREVEQRAGIGHTVIKDWRTRRYPDLQAIVAALNVVGLRLCAKEIDYDEAGREIVPVKASTNSKPVRDPSWQILC